jgi:hypothetical protein
MAAPSDFPTQEHLVKDTVASAIHALTIGNPSFDQILWDAHRHVLSFRRAGVGDYINLWLNRSHDPSGQHHSERNGGPAADSEVLWEEGRWVERDGRRRFEFTVPPDLRGKGEREGTSDEIWWEEYSTGDPPNSFRLTHIQTGIVVVGEGGRSVMENRRRAEELLLARLADRSEGGA